MNCTDKEKTIIGIKRNIMRFKTRIKNLEIYKKFVIDAFDEKCKRDLKPLHDAIGKYGSIEEALGYDFISKKKYDKLCLLQEFEIDLIDYYKAILLEHIKDIDKQILESQAFITQCEKAIMDVEEND